MCKEDLRVGRVLQINVRQATAPAANNLRVLEADPGRVRVWFHTAGGVVRVIPFGNDHNVAGNFAVSASTPPLLLRVEDYGKLVTGSWQIWGEAGAVSTMIGEATWGEA